MKQLQNCVLLGLLVALTSSYSLSAQERAVVPRAQLGNAYEPVVEVAGLPRVLLIGDSISEGYTLPVRKLLQGRANVLRIPQNGGPTKLGIEHIEQWLGPGKWDVIHFNWGLHDLMFFPDPKTEPVQYEKDRLELYERNLRVLVARLKQTGAKPIWATCKRRLKSAAGGARKVRHLPVGRERFLAFEVKSEKFAAR